MACLKTSIYMMVHDGKRVVDAGSLIEYSVIEPGTS